LTEKEKQARIDYIPVLRKRILEDLKELTEKITNNEPCPEKEQDIDMLIQISDDIENCLNNWYY
jgi:hypothetical protein